ncbi:MAG TPA: ABATE domain-containing protein [Actinomycetes bacterium]|jgi:predicted RNA-binding Zn ribbon-like protein|nr:ABATE domain-containing protein [Actinomycetes bacterium]
MNDRNLSTRRNRQTSGQGRTTEFPRLLGGRLCLHFVNTVEGPRSDHPVDFLTTYADLVKWSRHAGALEQSEADSLLAVAQSRAPDAEAVFTRALALRGAIEGVFRRIAHSELPLEADVALLQEEYAAALANARLTPSGTGYAWSWDHRPRELSRPLWLVAESAARLLTEGELSRIKECPGAGDCGWLFYDTSRNGRRRWCSMEGCGSRVKTRRQYARRQGTHRA